MNNFTTYAKSIYDNEKEKPALTYFQKIEKEEKGKSPNSKKKKIEFVKEQNYIKKSIQNPNGKRNSAGQNDNTSPSSIEKNRKKVNNSEEKIEIDLNISNFNNKHNFSNNLNKILNNINSIDSEKLEIFEELKKIKEFCLKKISNHEILGLENFIYNKSSFFKAVVVSNKLSYFKINIEIVRKMLFSEKHAENIFYEFSNNKIFSLIRRLFELIKNLIDNKNIKQINKFKYSDLKNNKNKSTTEGFNSVSNFNKLGRNNKLNKSNEFYNNILERNDNFDIKNSNSRNKKPFYSTDNKRVKDILKSKKHSINKLEKNSNSLSRMNNAEKIKNNIENIKLHSDRKFVLNSLKEFHNSNNNTLKKKEITNLDNNFYIPSMRKINSFNDLNNKEVSISINSCFTSKISPINKNFRKVDKNLFSEFFKEPENKNELIKLETIHEQNFDNTNYYKKNEFFPKKQGGNNFFNTKSINYSFSNIGISIIDNNKSFKNNNNSLSYLDLASFNENKNKMSETQTNLFNYIRNYEKSISDKNKNDQMLYLIRKNINEIKLNNPFLGGGRKQSEKKLNLKRRDYFIKNTINMNYEISNKNNNDKTEKDKNKNSKKLKKKKKSIKEKNNKNRHYSFDYGQIHKNYDFINLKNLKADMSENKNIYKSNKRKNLFDNNICITENSIINNNILKQNKSLFDIILQHGKSEIYPTINTLDSKNDKMNQTEDPCDDISLDSNKFNFEEEFKDKDKFSFNYDLNYMNTAPDKYDNQKTNKNPNLPHLSMVLNTYETLNTNVYSNSKTNNNRNYLDNINIETNFILQTGENLFQKKDYGSIRDNFNKKAYEKIGVISPINRDDKLIKRKITLRNKFEKEYNFNIESQKEIINNSNSVIRLNQIVDHEIEKNDFEYQTKSFSKMKNENDLQSNNNSKMKKKELTINFNNSSNDKNYFDNYSNNEFIFKNNLNNKNDEIEKTNLENLDDSKIETKSIFSNKLFSDNSFDEGIREQILSSNSFFVKTAKLNQIKNTKEKNDNEKFKNQTNK